MITADDARALVREAATGDRATAADLLERWTRAIESRARAGKRSARATDVSRPRQPVSDLAWLMVVEHLRAAGFVVACVPDGPNETTVEVSW
jgi:hypothetical protein